MAKLKLRGYYGSLAPPILFGACRLFRHGRAWRIAVRFRREPALVGTSPVMLALAASIHAFRAATKAWMAVTNPRIKSGGMTTWARPRSGRAGPLDCRIKSGNDGEKQPDLKRGHNHFAKPGQGTTGAWP